MSGTDFRYPGVLTVCTTADEGLFSGIKDKLAALSKTVSDPAKRAAQKEKLKKAMGDIKDKVSKKKENLSNQIDRLKDRFSKFKKQQLG